MPDCKHKSGDMIDENWVCAACFTRLHSRPVRYELERVATHGPVNVGQQYRQVIKWQAGIAECNGMTFGAFVNCMAMRLIARTRGHMAKSDALSYAIDLLRGLGEPFGSDDIAWDQGGAWELVDEDMSYWDSDEAASNS